MKKTVSRFSYFAITTSIAVGVSGCIGTLGSNFFQAGRCGKNFSSDQVYKSALKSTAKITVPDQQGTGFIIESSMSKNYTIVATNSHVTNGWNFNCTVI